jgi:hypothetical protein
MSNDISYAMHVCSIHVYAMIFMAAWDNSGWKPTNLTSVFTYGHPFIAALWYYLNGLCGCPYGCWQMLGRLIFHPPLGLNHFCAHIFISGKHFAKEILNSSLILGWGKNRTGFSVTFRTTEK